LFLISDEFIHHFVEVHPEWAAQFLHELFSARLVVPLFCISMTFIKNGFNNVPA
jgi:hypothetical protein